MNLHPVAIGIGCAIGFALGMLLRGALQKRRQRRELDDLRTKLRANVIQGGRR